MLSIIVPSYNQQEFLPDAIESAIKNNGFNFSEIIIVDDGSTDNSLEIARKYEKENLHIRVISQINKGLASARNTGIMNAENDWCFFLDADDIMVDDCSAKIIRAIMENPDVDIVAPSFKCFGKEQQEIILMDNPILEDFRTGNRIGYFSAIRKSKLLEVGGYNPRMLWGYEDLALWINLLSRGAKIKTLRDVLVLYRTKEQSMITTARQHHQELLDIINKDVPQAQLKF